jgi:hypothetical protein
VAIGGYKRATIALQKKIILDLTENFAGLAPLRRVLGQTP